MDALDEDLNSNPPPEGSWWRYFMGSDESQLEFSIAFPVKSQAASRNLPEMGVVPFHAVVGGWLMTTTARARDVSHALWHLRDPPVVSAILARALIELAASAWRTTEQALSNWYELKAHFAQYREVPQDVILAWADVFREWLGGRFDKSNDLKAAYSIQPTNAVTHVEKLNRVTDFDLVRAYEWLCNAAHPSLGGSVLYMSPNVPGPLDMYEVQQVMSALPIMRTHDGQLLRQYEAGQVRDSIITGSLTAIDALTIALAKARELLHDICLTAGVADLTVFNHYGLVQQSRRNEVCTCGSGKKAKHCQHSWSAHRPSPLPSSLAQPPQQDERYRTLD